MVVLDENATLELVQLPKDKKPIGCKWVYKVKHNENGNVSRQKARLVAKGYAQTYGIDFEETFSPKMAKIQAVIALATLKAGSYIRWIHQMDVKNAFLPGEL